MNFELIHINFIINNNHNSYMYIQKPQAGYFQAHSLIRDLFNNVYRVPSIRLGK